MSQKKKAAGGGFFPGEGRLVEEPTSTSNFTTKATFNQKQPQQRNKPPEQKENPALDFSETKGSITVEQERTLINLVVKLGRPKFAEYRRRARVGMTPIPRLSKYAAWRLIHIILNDLETNRR